MGFKLSDILTALGAGLASLGLPGVAAGLSTALVSSTIAGVVSTALQQAPTVAKGKIDLLVVLLGHYTDSSHQQCGPAEPRTPNRFGLATLTYSY